MAHKVQKTEDVLLSLPGSIAIVGNGHTGRNMGSVIDRHQSVIRINNYILDGFEELVGKKTTLRCTSGWDDIEVRHHYTEISPFRSDSAESAEIGNYKARGGESIITPETDIHLLLPEVPMPSTGLALAALASSLGLEVSLFGFDGFLSGHYWDPDPGTPFETVHCNNEREHLLKLPHLILYGISYDYSKLYDFCFSNHPDYKNNEGLRIYQKLALNLVGENILEYGAGCGDLSAYLEKQGNIVTAIEVSEVAFDRIPVTRKIRGDSLTLAQLEGYYDRFVSTDCLEHLTENDIRIVIREAARLARSFLVAVSTRPSGLLGPQGENLHLTIRTVEWWRELFSQFFKEEFVKVEGIGQIIIAGTRYNTNEVSLVESLLPPYDSFELPPGYIARDKAEYFIDSDEARTGIIWQPDVYSIAVESARSLGCKTLIDIGCGHAQKLTSFYPEFDIIGIDYGANIEWCRKEYPYGIWLESNFEQVKLLPLPADLLEHSFLICSDVIEHLSDPRALIRTLLKLLTVAPALLLTTPDRVKTWGMNHLGPPPNSSHTREWSLDELKKLLVREGFEIATIAHTRSNNLNNELATILVQVTANKINQIISKHHQHHAAFASDINPLLADATLINEAHIDCTCSSNYKSEHTENHTIRGLVSIIIPTYNCQNWICDAIDASLNQTYLPCEVIVVDDGSTDNTKSLLDTRYPTGKIKYVYQENSGLSVARNRGIEESRGEYIQFLDSDDVITTDKIEIQVNALINIQGYAVSYSDYCCIDIMNNSILEDRYLSPRTNTESFLSTLIADWETRFSIPVHCFLFKSSLFIGQNIRFDPSLPNHEDWDCWVRVFSLMPEVVYVDSKLAYYRIKPASMCTDRALMRYGFIKCIDKYIDNFDDTKLVEMLKKKRDEIEKCYADISDELIRTTAILMTTNHNQPGLATRLAESSVNKPSLIAFHLPQFHSIPENDEWWGKGFTEWTNVSKAVPNFPSHYQPHVPTDLGYYDLSDPSVMQAQAMLARKYGIHGFCFYHYWFNGKLLLETPLHHMLKSGEPDFPFCLCWANENWTRAWDGQSGEILIGQNYTDADDVRHMYYLGSFFEDPRYIRIDGKPLFLVYRANQIPDPLRTTTTWREVARKLGLGEIYLCRVESFFDEHTDPAGLGFDAAIEFQPDWVELGNVQQLDIPDAGDNSCYDYADVVREMIGKQTPDYNRFPCVFPSWDNSPRRKTNAVVIHDASPQVYKNWLKESIKKVKNSSVDEKIVFINAWNEWGEGNHLEPDTKHGRGYLEATQKAIDEASQEIYRFSVTIIIPVHNELGILPGFLEAIVRTISDVSFEIIIVDNGSTDGTANYLDTLVGSPVSVIRNAAEMGFDYACKQAADCAHGEHLVFMHCNPKVPRGWLGYLVGLMIEDYSLTAVSANLWIGGDATNCSCDCLVVRHDVFNQIRIGIDITAVYADVVKSGLANIVQKLGYKSRHFPSYNNVVFRFNEDVYEPFDGNGWVGPDVIITVPDFLLMTPLNISFDLFAPKVSVLDSKMLVVKIYVDGDQVQTYVFTRDNEGFAVQLQVPAVSRNVSIKIQSKAYFVPELIGESDDFRKLSLLMQNLQYQNLQYLLYA